MTRVHDMGGRYGDGPVVPEPQGTVPFEKDWHRGALALTLAAGALGTWNIDTSRHARESLAPKDYARFSYYEKWMAALADLLVAKGLVSEAELAAGTASEGSSSSRTRPSHAAGNGPATETRSSPRCCGTSRRP